ncbi:hypothetical protein ACFL6A_01120 [bacterium]
MTTSQLFFLAFFLVSYKKGNKTSNRILIAFLSVNAVYDLIFVIFYSGLLTFSAYPPIYVIKSSLYIVLAQILFFYINSFRSEGFHLYRRHLFHLLPFFLITLISVLIHHNWPNVLFSKWGSIIRVTIIHAILVSYLITAFSRIRQYKTELRNYFSNSRLVNIGWLQFILMTFTLMWLVDVIAIILIISSLYTSWIIQFFTILSLFINLYFAVILVYKGMRQSDLFSGIGTIAKSRSSDLSKSQLKEYAEKLKNTMRAEKPFLEPSLTIRDLSDMTSIPVRHLSRVINEYLNQNFFDFISNYRIDEVKKGFLDPEKKT